MSPPRASVVLAVLAGLVLLGAAVATPRPGEGQTSSTAPYRLVRPAGAGPHPALLFVSGCSGFAPHSAPDHYPRMARGFAAEGFAVVFVDYLGARHRGSCGGMIRPNNVVADIMKAVDYARAQPFVRASDITVIGWSMGGGGALAAIFELPAGRPPPFRRVIAYYPECKGVGSPWAAKVPVLMLLAGRDEVSPTLVCDELVQRVGAGHPVEIRVYPEARHAFDVAELPPLLLRAGAGPIGSHPQSAAAAREEVRRFLSR
jgi:dienelactone hydrolase